MKNLLLTILCACSFFLYSCIQTSNPDTPKRISFLLNVDNVGSTVAVGQDTLEVSEIKFVADKFNLVMPDGVILQTGVDALVMTYRSQFNGEDENVLSANIGFEDIDRFRGLELFIDQPEDDDEILDKDFFGDGDTTNYSLIIKGVHNRKEFTYKSAVSFTKSFEFDNVIELTNSDETLILRMVSDIREIFIEQSSNQILNPLEPNHKAAIDSLFKNSIEIEAFASNLF